MTEYWVSQAKFYCKYCSCWIADNKPSRQHHDGGVKHKLAVELFHKKKREEKLGGIHSERELQHQLEAIEKAAREAVAADRSTYQGQFFLNSKRQAPPPPPRNHGQYPSLASSKPEDQPEELNVDKSGIYEIRGQTYLEGQIHQDKLKKGSSCEIFVEAADDWLSAVITARKEVIVPNTEVTLISFTVVYQAPSQDAPADSPEGEAVVKVTEDNVRSDRLRLLADKEGNVITAGVVTATEGGDGGDGAEDAAGPKDVKPVIVESTGLGAWQTVSVRVVDEEAEEAALLAQQEEERQAAASAQNKKRKDFERAVMLAEAAADAESALGSYDPYHTNVYKGVNLGTETIITEIESVSNGKKVAFKKRKKGPDLTSSSGSSSISSSNSSGSSSGSSSRGEDSPVIPPFESVGKVEKLVTIKEEHECADDGVSQEASTVTVRIDLSDLSASSPGGSIPARGGGSKIESSSSSSSSSSGVISRPPVQQPLSFAMGNKMMSGGSTRKIRTKEM